MIAQIVKVCIQWPVRYEEGEVGRERKERERGGGEGTMEILTPPKVYMLE